MFIFLLIPGTVLAKEKEVNLYLFYSKDCPHCAAEKKELANIQKQYPYLNIYTYEITYNEKNNKLLSNVETIFNINVTHVPFTVIGEKYYTGYSSAIKKKMVNTINNYMNSNYEDATGEMLGLLESKYVNNGNGQNSDKDDGIFTIPILGEINAKDISLPLISIFIGLIDGFNPCAMWVLLFLIGMLINMEDKKKSWWIGITFLVTSALVYLFFMLALLSVTMYIGNIIYIRYLIALVALIGGILSFKSGIKKETGCEVIDDKKRKKLVNQIKNIVKQQKFTLAILGVVILAISVNMIDALCSAGLPMIFMQILAFNYLSLFEYIIYIFLYLLFFLIIDITIFVIAMKTLNVKVISNKFGKLSHIIGGIILITIAILMILKPSWLMFNF
jgi:glutaredoxin